MPCFGINAVTWHFLYYKYNDLLFDYGLNPLSKEMILFG